MLKIQNRKNHEKEIYYIKRLLQEKRDSSDYGRNMIIIMLKLYVITHTHIYIPTPPTRTMVTLCYYHKPQKIS